MTGAQLPQLSVGCERRCCWRGQERQSRGVAAWGRGAREARGQQDRVGRSCSLCTVWASQGKGLLPSGAPQMGSAALMALPTLGTSRQPPQVWRPEALLPPACSPAEGREGAQSVAVQVQGSRRRPHPGPPWAKSASEAGTRAPRQFLSLSAPAPHRHKAPNDEPVDSHSTLDPTGQPPGTALRVT